MRIPAVFLAVLALAGSAGAASLAVAPDKPIYSLGETITLTITGDDGGAAAYSVFGQLRYDGFLAGPGTRTQISLGPGWTLGNLKTREGGTADAFNQIHLPSPSDSPVLPGTLSVVTLIARGMGIVDVTWVKSPGIDGLVFFGLTDAPGTSFTIVPEPGTLTLLGLGLLSLAASHRPRRE